MILSKFSKAKNKITLNSRFAIFLLVLFVFLSVKAQKYDHYSVEDGLPGNMVYRVTQDKKGFVWAITDKGIARFNGNTFKIFNTKNGLPTNDIWDIQITNDHKLWYFSKSASLGYIENNEVFDFPAENPDEQLFPAIIFKIDNDIYFGYNNLSYYLHDGQWKLLDEATASDDDEKLARYLRYKNKMGDFVAANKQRYQRGLLRVLDSLGIIIGEKSYAVLNLNSNDLFEYNFPEAIKAKDPGLFRVHAVNGELQFTGPEFVANMDNDYQLVNLSFFSEDLKAHFAMRDKLGNLWMASLNQGLYKLPAVNRKNKYWLEGKRVRQLEDTPLGIIASVQDYGFYLYNASYDSFDLLNKSEGFVYGTAYIDQLSAAFLLTSKGIVKVNANGILQSFSPMARKICYHEGYLYGNVSSGLNQIDPIQMQVTRHIKGVGIKDIISYNNMLIVGTSNGLKQLKNDSLLPIQINGQVFSRPIMNLGKLPSGILLITTDGFGAYRTDLEEITQIEKTEYLSANSQVVQDNNLWLSTSQGVLQYDLDQTKITLKNTIGTEYGVPSVNTHTILAQGDALWIGTDNGLVKLPSDLQKQDQYLGIYVEKGSYAGKEINKVDKVDYQKSGTLSYVIGTIDFSQKKESSPYEYRLYPFETKWITTTSNIINFSNLPPNDYTLQLRKGQNSSTHKFSISPLWWQKPISKVVFVSLGSLLLLLLLLQIRRYEINKKLSKLEIQNKLTEFELYALRSQMNPHFVFNSLAAIQYCINNGDIRSAESYLVKFSRLVRQFFELSKQKEVTVSKEVELLKNYLDIEKLRFNEKLEYSIKIGDSVEVSKVNIPTMLLQPVVENAINHGIFNKESKGRVDIRFQQNGDNSLEVEIEDNGVGFVNTKKTDSGKRTSSHVLEDRLLFLNKSGKWDISLSHREAYPEKEDKGNITTFKITAIA
ncbi:hypothetical protein C5O00_10745 [Pukyongia salina]|uniref:Signal transduction histidine kinase internal region domain-containing protein n=1 Tax=Pukyongia salina TaxID=2094025 RepID=A0A2S0HZL6_9FLAO|nr:hypothetical protein C5O00_10745 [Pukyongia salina]